MCFKLCVCVCVWGRVLDAVGVSRRVGLISCVSHIVCLVVVHISCSVFISCVVYRVLCVVCRVSYSKHIL